MKILKILFENFLLIVKSPRKYRVIFNQLLSRLRGLEYGNHWDNVGITSNQLSSNTYDTDNPLRTYFDANLKGKGIWKWLHYFETYHRHFEKFVGKEVHIVEVGIYSGGSLDMWRSYFGINCHVYGVDIQEECKTYEKEGVKIFIGDQANREFWKDFKRQVPRVDVVVDDGGHQYLQQLITLEEMLPHLQPGGVFICEDVQGSSNRFASYVYGLQDNLNEYDYTNEGELKVAPSNFQKHIHSIHHYPYIIVIERNNHVINKLVAPKHGTHWQPFFD